MSDLFGKDGPAPPLAERLRPQTIADVVGQEHLTGPNGAIGRMLAAGKLSSMILWGPPGTGKTLTATLIGKLSGRFSPRRGTGALRRRSAAPAHALRAAWPSGPASR